MLWFRNIFFLVLLVAVRAQDDANNGNDLNTALQLILSEMNNESFFINTWSQFYPLLPVPVTDNCYNGKKVGLDVADESLKSVIERQSLRIGVTPLAALYPALFSQPNNVSKVKSFSSSSSTIGSTPENFTLTLTTETLDGYEIVCAKEAAKRLGELYDIEITADFKLLPTDSFFPPLVDALNNDEVDIVWSAVFVLDERKAIVDYVCNEYTTEIVIGASFEVGPTRPDPNGPPVKLPCYGGFCDFKPPLPFTLVELYANTSNFDLMNLVVTTTDEFNYTMGPIDRMRMFFIQYCPNCTVVQMPFIATLNQAPLTKKMNKTEPGSKGMSDAFFLLRVAMTSASAYQSCMVASLLFFVWTTYL